MDDYSETTARIVAINETLRILTNSDYWQLVHRAEIERLTNVIVKLATMVELPPSQEIA